jgi:hypothetical protein
MSIFDKVEIFLFCLLPNRLLLVLFLGRNRDFGLLNLGNLGLGDSFEMCGIPDFIVNPMFNRGKDILHIHYSVVHRQILAKCRIGCLPTL